MRWLVFTILLACKGDKPPPAPEVGSGSPAPTAKVGVPDRPSLPSETPKPSLPEPPAKPSTDATFEGEQRDAGWASETEYGIKERFAKVRGAKLEGLSTEARACPWRR